MRRKLLRGFVSILGADMFRFVSMLVMTPLLVRILSKQEYGTYVFLLSVFEIGYVAVNAGVTESARKFLAETRELSGWREQVFGLIVRVAVVPAFLVVGGFYVLAEMGILSSLFGGSLTSYLTVIILVLVSYQYFRLMTNSLMALSLEHFSEPVKSIQVLSFTLVGVLLAYLGYGIEGVFAGHIIGSAIAGTAGLGLLSTQIDVSGVFRRSDRDFPRMEILRFNSYSSVYNLFYESFYYTDILIIQALLGSEQTAYYGAALMISELLRFVPMTVQSLLLHSVSDLWRTDQVKTITDLSSTLSRYVLALSALLAIGVGVLADEVVSIYYGDSFAPAVTLLLILLPGTLCFVLTLPIQSVIHSKGQLTPLVMATGVAAVLNLGMNLALVPTYGAVGAAVATTVGYVFMLPLNIWAARRVGFSPLSDLRESALLISSTVTLLAVYAVDVLIESAILSLIVIPPLGFGLFVKASMQTGLTSWDEVDILIEPLPNSVRQAIDRVL